MPVDVTQLEEVGPVDVSQLQEVGPAQPQQWETMRGPPPKESLLSWLNPFKGMSHDRVLEIAKGLHQGEGFTGSLMDAAGLQEGPVSKFVGEKVIDPGVSVLATLPQGLGAAIPYGEQISRGISKADEMLAPMIASEGELAPTPVADTGKTMQADVKATLLSHPATLASTLAPGIAKGLKGLRGEAPPVVADQVGTPPNPAVDLLQKQLKPSAATEFGQNFEKNGANALRQAIAEEPNVGPGNNFDRLAQMSKNVQDKLGAEQAAMIQHGVENGQVGSRRAISQGLSRVANEPFYKYLDPDTGNMLRNYFPAEGPDIPLPELQDVLTHINKQIRSAQQAVGSAADSKSVVPRLDALTAVGDVLRKQLNEKASRTPNEWLENYRNYSDVAQLEDLVNKAKTVARNADEKTLGQAIKDAAVKAGTHAVGGAFLGAGVGHPIIGGAVGAIHGLLSDLASSGRSSRNVGKALEIAKTNVPPGHEPFGPQRPSETPGRPTAPLAISRPQAKPVLVPQKLLDRFAEKQFQAQHQMAPWTPTGPEDVVHPPENMKIAGGLQPEVAPVSAVPTWVENVQRTTTPPIEQYRAIQHAKQIINGKVKMTYAEALADPDISPWEKTVLKNLAKNPANAREVATMLEAQIKSKVQPF